MKKIKYFAILKRAFMITWKNKFLWLFGLMVFFGSFSLSLSFNSENAAEQAVRFQRILNYFQEHPKFFLEIFLASVALMAILFLLRIIGLTALIKSANNIVVYRQSKVSAIFSEARKYLWQLVLLEIIIGAALMMVMTVLFIPIAYLMMLEARTFALASAVIAIFIITALAIITYYIWKYAYFYVVLGNMKIIMALEAAYALLRKNIYASLMMGCVGVALGVLMMMLLSVLLLLLVFIFSPVNFAVYLIFAKTNLPFFSVIGTIIGGAVLLVVCSFFTAFAQSAWVLFFQEISLDKREENKVFENIKVAEKIPDPEVV